MLSSRGHCCGMRDSGFREVLGRVPPFDVWRCPGRPGVVHGPPETNSHGCGSGRSGPWCRCHRGLSCPHVGRGVGLCGHSEAWSIRTSSRLARETRERTVPRGTLRRSAASE